MFGRCCVTTIPQRIGPVVVSLERKCRRTDRGQPDSRCIVRCSHVLAGRTSGPADSPVRAGPKVMVCGVKERKEGEKMGENLCYNLGSENWGCFGDF